MKKTGKENEIRGVGPFHSRVYPESDADLDRLHQAHGVPAAWMEPEGPDEFEQPPLLAFMHALIHIGSKQREVFFARVQNLSWAEIGDSLLNGATAQAAENQFSETIKHYPALQRAVPKTTTEEET